MSQRQAKVLNPYPIRQNVDQQKHTQKYCIYWSIIIILLAFSASIFLSNIFNQTTENEALHTRVLQVDDDYLTKKTNYGVVRRTVLRNQQLYPDLKLIESNLDNGEEIQDSLKNLEEQQYNRLDSSYHFADFKKQLPFCIILQGLNFSTPFLFQYTLNSIFSQNYTNYKAIIYNFGDEGNKFIVEYFKTNKVKKENYIFVKNKDYKGIIENILSASQGHCQKDSISLNIVGNHELIGKNVFKTFNAVYQSNKVGMVYSNFYIYNQGGPIIEGFNIAHAAEDLNNIRSLKFAISSPVTYITEHILKIQPEDLKDSNGGFLDLAFEQAIFFPIIDITCKKIIKIDGFHLAVKSGINTYEEFKKFLILKNQPSMIARNKKRYNCDESFNNLIRHKAMIHHREYLIEEPALKSISQKRSQKEGIAKPIKVPRNFDVTPEISAKLGQYLYKDEHILKAREQFERQRINLINLQNREDSKKTIKYNLRLGDGVDKQQAKLEQYQTFQADYRHKIYKVQNELPICIVVQDLQFEYPYLFRFEHVLNSIFNQNYTNFFTVIINQDLRMDEFVRKYLFYNKVVKQRFVYIENYEERSPSQMLHKALTSHCSYDSYSLLFDGSGQMLGKNTLKIFNRYFQETTEFLYSNSYLFTQKEANLHYSKTEEYSQEQKKNNRYRNTNKKFDQLFGFKTELYYGIDVEDFQDVNGKFLDGSLQTHVLLSILELSCQKVRKIIGVHYLTNEDVKKAKPEREMSYIVKNKKKYECSKDKKLSLKETNLDLTGRPQLQKISQKHTQKEGTIPTKQVQQFDFLIPNEEGQTIDQYLYQDDKMILKERTKYQLERASYLKLKNNDDSRQLIQFNLLIDGHANPNQAALQSEDYAIIKKIYADIGTAPEVPICAVVDRFSFYIPFKFEYTLNSIFAQNYSNFFVVIFGDGSKAGNALIRKYLHFYRIPKSRFVYIENDQKKGTLQNTLNAVNNYCSKDSLVINVAGQDELIGKNVFKYFSAGKQKSNALFLYSNTYYYSQGVSLDYGKSSQYSEDEIKRNSYRTSHKYQYPLFYSSELLRKIDVKDLKFTDTAYYQATFDTAIIIPMMQLSCGRVQKLLGVHYLFNNDRKVVIDKSLLQRQTAKLASQRKYECGKDFQLKK